MQQINVGLVGYGKVAKTFHIPLLRAEQRLRLSAVATGHGVNEVRAELPDVSAVSSVDELLATDVELVVVTSANGDHFSQAQAALTAGKHVVIEKPMTITVNEADQLIALAKQQDVLLTVFHNRRWDNGFLTVEQLLEAGLLGDVMSYTARYDRYRPEVLQRWREEPLPGSGYVFDIGSHLIHGALLLFGTPDWIIGDVEAQRDGAKVDDYFHIELGYGRTRVFLGSSALTVANEPAFAVHGTTGSFVKNGLDPQEPALLEGGLVGGRGWGEDQPERYGWLTLADKGTERVHTVPGRWEAFYAGVVDAIRNGDPPPIDPKRARDVIALIEATYESARSGQRIHGDQLNLLG